jgi:hypothetical protein
MGIAETLVAVAVVPWFGTASGDTGPPPQPYTEKVTLPGGIPADVTDLAKSWMYGYSLKDAVLKEGRRELFVTITVNLKADGSYELLYGARWGELGGVISKGLKVQESGKYSLSGEVLLLEPQTTVRTDIKYDSVVKQQTITNENHVWIVRAEKKRLHVAGRCARYQMDPVCQVEPNVWFSLSAEGGVQFIGR